MKKPKKEAVMGYIKAQVYGQSGTGPASVKVPVFVSVIPEVPEVILIKGWLAAAVKISDSPLAYRLVRTAKVKYE